MSISGDRFDPPASLPPADRLRLRQMAASVARAVWDDLVASLGADEDGRWRADTGRDERGWTSAERRRFRAWMGTGQSVDDARLVLRATFVAYLLVSGRIGQGDEVVVRP